MNVRWRLAVFPLLLAACAEVDRSAGGSSYETENAFAARVVGRSLPGDTVVSLTQGRRTVADAQGNFLLDSLRRGVHALYGRVSKGRAYVDLERAGTATSLLRPEDSGSVLLDDFEDGDSRHRYGAWTGGGWWWIACDTSVTLSPSGIASSPSLALAKDSAGGRSLHFAAAFSGSGASDWAETGVHLDTGAVDLSRLKAVRFRAKGSGNLTVRLLTRDAVAGQNLEENLALGADWRTFELPVAGFQLPAWSGSSVDSAGRIGKLRQCVGLAWALGESGEVWLDDATLVGPSASSLWPTLPVP